MDLDFLQSSEWGEIKKPEWQPLRVVIDDVPVSILTRKLPLLGKKFGYVPRGFNEQIFTSELVKGLVDHCKNKLHLSHLVIEPNLDNQKEFELLFKEIGFINTGKTIQPNQTYILDLSKSEEALWMDLRASFRRNIKKSSARFNCRVEKFENGDEAVERFILVSEKINTRKKFIKHTPAYFRKAWNILSPKGMAKIFIVVHEADGEKEDVAAYFLAYTKNEAFELYGGVTDSGKPLRAGHLLKWECIKDAKASGLKLYDQWGVARFLGNDFDKNDELYYITEFKSSFGGKYKEFLQQQTIVFDKMSCRIYNFLQKVNKLKLKLLKKV